MSEERKAYEVLSSKIEELVTLYNNEYYIDIEPCYLTIFPDGQIAFTLIITEYSEEDGEILTEEEVLIMACKFYSMNEDSIENALAKHFKKRITIGKKEVAAWRKKDIAYKEKCNG